MQKTGYGLNRYARMMIRRYPQIAGSWLGSWWYLGGKCCGKPESGDYASTADAGLPKRVGSGLKPRK